MILAELGADVVRVERPGGASPLAVDTALNRSRPNVAVDLKQAAGVDVVHRLLDQADVLIEGLRPGVMERLGLGPEVCLARNPRLVYGRMTGWGQEGPYATMAGHDIMYAAVSGALHLCGTAEKPIVPVNVLADFGGGTLYLVTGVLAALLARGSTGRGQVLDAAMVDGAASLVTMFYGLFAQGLWQDRRGVNILDGGAPFYDTYECADGRWVAVGALEPQFWRALNEELGLRFERGQYDPQGYAVQRAAYERAFQGRTRDEWAAHFAGTDACVAPVLGLGEAPRDPHLAARGVFAEVDGQTVPRVAPRFSAGPLPEPTPGRGVGADTVDYLSSHGFSREEVDALLTAGVLVQA